MTALFRTSYQQGFFSVFFSAGSNPLNLWETHIKDGYISRFLDPQLKTLVLDIGGHNVSTTYMVCPKGRDTLGLHLPFMVMIVKNLKKYFSFEVTIRDDYGFKRRFRVSNFQSATKITPTCTAMPIGLTDGWNQIQFNLADFTRRAYNKQFAEVVSLKVNANIRLRRIYFADRLVPEEELPNEYRLFIPLPKKSRERKTAEVKENVAPQTSKEMVEILTQGSKAEIVRKPSRETAQKVDSKLSLKGSLNKIEEAPGEDQKVEKVESQVTKRSSKESVKKDKSKDSIKEKEEKESEELAEETNKDEGPTVGEEKTEGGEQIPAESDDIQGAQGTIEEEDKARQAEASEEKTQEAEEPENVDIDKPKEDVAK